MKLQELVEYIVKALVDNAEEVSVVETTSETVSIIEVKVPAVEVGKVIGKGGKIANSIRTIAKASGAKDKKRVTVEIVTKEEKQ
jgi:predicted RNA-binding protein YlqC (UPF0109 family)